MVVRDSWWDSEDDLLHGGPVSDSMVEGTFSTTSSLAAASGHFAGPDARHATLSVAALRDIPCLVRVRDSSEIRRERATELSSRRSDDRLRQSDGRGWQPSAKWTRGR